ncbi:MAG: hypothetical protein SFX18_13305 [Pirellulales bacterium]|nr:hypothetical protein [Pirellulales bacterium]
MRDLGLGRLAEMGQLAMRLPGEIKDVAQAFRFIRTGTRAAGSAVGASAGNGANGAIATAGASVAQAVTAGSPAASGGTATVGPAVATGAATAAGGAAAGGGAATTGAAAGAATAGGAMAAMAATLGPVGIAVAALTVAVAVSVIAFKALSAAVKSQTAAISQYSPELSIAESIGEIRQMQAEIRRADAIGPGLAKMYDAISRIETIFYDIGTSCLKLLVKIFELLEPFIEFMIDTLGLIAAAIDFGVDDLVTIIDLFTDPVRVWTEDLGKLKELLGKINKAIQAFGENGDEIDDFGDKWLGQLSALYTGMGGVRLAPPANIKPRPAGG